MTNGIWLRCSTFAGSFLNINTERYNCGIFRYVTLVSIYSWKCEFPFFFECELQWNAWPLTEDILGGIFTVLQYELDSIFDDFLKAQIISYCNK